MTWARAVMTTWVALALAGLGALAGCEAEAIDRELGARCSAQADCARLCLTPGPDYPGGMCSRACSGADECPADALCADRQAGVCLYTCRDDGDCEFLGSHDDGSWTCQDVMQVGGVAGKACLGPGQ